MSVKNELKHIAIIMDGNGRWAKAQGKPRAYGHKIGVDALNRTVRACKKFNIRYLSVFAFSVENWGRPKAEVDGLMALLKINIKKLEKEAIENKVAVKILGDKSAFDSELQTTLVEVEKNTAQFTDFYFNIALNYGGKEDIVNACKAVSSAVVSGEISIDDIDNDLIENNLYTAGQPPVDLMIRTSNEHRISNFLLWQLAYAEMVFLPVHWPDFDEVHLKEAIDIYNGRERRFGKV